MRFFSCLLLFRRFFPKFFVLGVVPLSASSRALFNARAIKFFFSSQTTVLPKVKPRGNSSAKELWKGDQFVFCDGRSSCMNTTMFLSAAGPESWPPRRRVHKQVPFFAYFVDLNRMSNLNRLRGNFSKKKKNFARQCQRRA